MKTTLIALFIFATLTTRAQQKQDSLVIEIRMDTATWKTVVGLIRETISEQTQTGRVLLYNILSPLYQYKLVPREKIVADKPKEVKPKN